MSVPLNSFRSTSVPLNSMTVPLNSFRSTSVPLKEKAKDCLKKSSGVVGQELMETYQLILQGYPYMDDDYFDSVEEDSRDSTSIIQDKIRKWIQLFDPDYMSDDEDDEDEDLHHVQQIHSPQKEYCSASQGEICH